MKKYFITDTEDELQFGDIIELEFVKDRNGKTLHKHLEIEFTPVTIAFLLSENIIEEREVSEEEQDTDPNEEEGMTEEEIQDYFDAIFEDIEALEMRIEELEDKTKKTDEKVLIELRNILAAIKEAEEK
jgi:hypothetical protein